MDRGLVTSWIHQSPISTPPNTHRYLVPASLIGGSLWGVRNPDQCPHLHHWTPIDEVARVPATPTGRPRLPRHPSGGKWDKELAWRPRRNGHERGARAGRPRLPGVGSPGRRLRCRSPSPSRLGSVPLVSATSVTKFVGRKEADRVGSWRLRYVYLRQINSHRCALCVTRKHQLSRSSPRSLSVFVPTVSLWQLVRSSLHSVSLLELPFHGGFYPVSTPITTIRHRMILILHLTHLLTAVSWVFLPLQTSLNHAPLATKTFQKSSSLPNMKFKRVQKRTVYANTSNVFLVETSATCMRFSPDVFSPWWAQTELLLRNTSGKYRARHSRATLSLAFSNGFSLLVALCIGLAVLLSFSLFFYLVNLWVSP